MDLLALNDSAMALGKIVVSPDSKSSLHPQTCRMQTEFHTESEIGLSSLEGREQVEQCNTIARIEDRVKKPQEKS
jgi:hypothetical protein